ncbi:MAG: ATP-dependent helicase HrpB [Myxococcota bacterium]
MNPSDGGGIGKAADELMREMQEAQIELQQLENKKIGGGSNVAFEDALKAQQSKQIDKAVQVGELHKAANVLQQAKINATRPTVRVGAAAKIEESRMLKMLDRLVGGQDRMAGIMKMALSGKQFSPSELIAMQAGVYRFSQELELTTKVVEKATSGIKQTMNTQV